MPRDESEAWCTTFLMKMCFNLHANKTHFHMKSCALSLAFITRHKATWKWLIEICSNQGHFVTIRSCLHFALVWLIALAMDRTAVTTVPFDALSPKLSTDFTLRVNDDQFVHIFDSGVNVCGENFCGIFFFLRKFFMRIVKKKIAKKKFCATR